MDTDPTIRQDSKERLRSQEKSMEREQPPTEVPGYEPEHLLGVGAYGEVWVAVEGNTGRRVAIKFYAHRGGLDWSLLSREVEKLAFLFGDRYVVQLIGVGWNAEPPYYIMEYLEPGSLAERLADGALPASEAADLFRDVAVGLVHAHGKGVLHCDLKPANILLDQDGKPRLADFGQSRLSHEQVPALGTLFYMAPEQANLEAVPDARWDVYALGALLYCMLTGEPPRRSDDAVTRLERAMGLESRLTLYRRMIRKSPPPTAHRQVPGVDRALAGIIDRCLAIDPQKRYPNVQAVLDALDARAAWQARRPMMLLGATGPALLLLVVSWFVWQGFSDAVEQSDQALTESRFSTNEYFARYVARTAGHELDRRYRAVEQVASDGRLRELLRQTLYRPESEDQRRLGELATRLREAELESERRLRLEEEFCGHQGRKQLQEEFAALAAVLKLPNEAGWFLTDARGMQVARAPQRPTIGRNFDWRTYFHGGQNDLAKRERPLAGRRHIAGTTLSTVFRSEADFRWKVAISAPIIDHQAGDEFLGVVALMIDLGWFVELHGGDQQFAVLVDWREGDNKGVILEHPVFRQLESSHEGRLPDLFKEYRVADTNLPAASRRLEGYRDPLYAELVEDTHQGHKWLAQMEPVPVRGQNTGLVVIVQDEYDRAIGDTLAGLWRGLIRYGLGALSVIVLLMMGLWGLATRLLDQAVPSRLRVLVGNGTARPESSVGPDAPTQTQQHGGSDPATDR